jgi:hypothetical protein
MPPENFSFGGGANETVLHPLVLVAMLLAIALILLLPRKYVIVPLLAITFMVPFGQELLISGLHFFVYRIVVLAASLRILFSMLSCPVGHIPCLRRDSPIYATGGRHLSNGFPSRCHRWVFCPSASDS